MGPSGGESGDPYEIPPDKSPHVGAAISGIKQRNVFESYTAISGAKKVHMLFTGPDESTIFTDDSGRTWSPSGSARIYSNSLLVDGSSYIYTDDVSVDFDCGTDTDFYYDFKVVFTTLPAEDDYAVIADIATGQGSMHIVRYGDPWDLIVWEVECKPEIGGQVMLYWEQPIGDFVLGKSYHVLVSRSGSTWSLSVDDDVKQTVVDAATQWGASDGVMTIGNVVV
jgi:hypothetical protein